MATTTVVGSYVYNGGNPSLEIQNLKLEYTWSVINKTQGKISAKLYIKRDAYGPSWNVTGIYSVTATVPEGDITIVSGSHKPTQSSPIDTTYRLVGEGEEIFNLKDGGATATNISLKASYSISGNLKLKGLVLPASEYTQGTASQTGSLSAEIPAQIGACGAPSAVTVNNGRADVMTLNGEVQVTWELGSAGMNNDISGYVVYWRATAQNNDGSVNSPTIDSYTGKSSVLSSSTKTYTLKLSESNGALSAIRGGKLKVGVITIGSVSGYDSSMTTSDTYMTINSLPSKPTLTITDSIYRPGSVINITDISVSDADSSQVIKLKYNTSDDITSASDLALSNNRATFSLPSTSMDAAMVDYYFWSYDGLECSSSYQKVTLKISSAINFSASMSGTKLTTTPSNSDYCIAPKITITNSLINGNYVYKLMTSSSKTGTYTETGYVYNAPGSSKSYNISDIRVLIKEKIPTFLNNGGYYKFKITYTSALNETSTIETSPLYVSKKPVCTLYNFTDGVNKTIDSKADLFYNKASIVFPYDEGYSNIDLTVTSSNGKEIYKIESNLQKATINGIVSYISNYNFSNSFTESLYYSFSAILKQNNYSLDVGKLGELKQIKKISQPSISFMIVSTSNAADGLGTEDNPYHLFTGQQINFKVSGSAFSLEDMSEYGIGSSDKLLNYNKDSINKNFSIVYNKSLNRYDFSISGADLFNMFYNQKTNLTYSVPLTLSLTNSFGLKTTFEIAFYCTLKESATKSLTGVDFFTDISGTKTSVSSVNYIKEGMPIYFSCNEFSVFGSSCEIKIYYINRNNQPILLGNKALTLKNNSLSYNTGATYSAVNKVLINSMPEMSDSFTGKFTAELVVSTPVNSTNKLVSYIISTNVEKQFNIERHQKASFSFRGVELDLSDSTKVYFKLYFNKGQDLGLKYVSTSSGFIKQNSISAKIKYTYDKTTICEQTLSDLTLEKLYTQESLLLNPASAANFPSKWNSVEIQVELTISHTFNNYTTTKTQIVTPLLLFNILPTISYRKNFLGINTQNFPSEKTDGVLFISEYENYKKIYLVSAEGSIKEIDLVSGALDGFKIDGGSW